MTKPESQQPEGFNSRHIVDAEDRLDTTNLKLRAIINVTMESNLECLGDGNPDGENLRHGLGYILLELADEHEQNIAINRCFRERWMGSGDEL